MSVEDELATKIAGMFGDGDDTDAIMSVVGPAIAELQASRQAWAEEALRQEHTYRELLGDIWLYINWRYVTKQLTTEQKELWADVVDRFGEEADAKADRWWQSQPCSCGHEPDRHLVIAMTPGCKDCDCKWFSAAPPVPTTVCACVPDDEATALVDVGWSLPQCTVHPDCPAHGKHPHQGMKCLDCPECVAVAGSVHPGSET